MVWAIYHCDVGSWLTSELVISWGIWVWMNRGQNRLCWVQTTHWSKRPLTVEHNIFYLEDSGMAKSRYIWFRECHITAPSEKVRGHSLRYQKRIVHNATWTIISKAKEEETIKNKPVSMQKKDIVNKTWGMMETQCRGQYCSSQQLAQMSSASQYLWIKAWLS